MQSAGSGCRDAVSLACLPHLHVMAICFVAPAGSQHALQFTMWQYTAVHLCNFPWCCQQLATFHVTAGVKLAYTVLYTWSISGAAAPAWSTREKTVCSRGVLPPLHQYSRPALTAAAASSMHIQDRSQGSHLQLSLLESQCNVLHVHSVPA
jgi:hypothetical protein